MLLIITTLYETIEFWVPLVAAFGLVIKAFSSVRKGIREWADSLLHNHLAHIQTACESTASTLKAMSIANAETATAIKQVATDIQHQQELDTRTQAEVQTALEVIRVQTAK